MEPITIFDERYVTISSKIREFYPDAIINFIDEITNPFLEEEQEKLGLYKKQNLFRYSDTIEEEALYGFEEGSVFTATPQPFDLILMCDVIADSPFVVADVAGDCYKILNRYASVPRYLISVYMHRVST